MHCLKKLLQHIAIFSAILFSAVHSFGQFKVKGTVYDSSHNYVLPGVTVLSTSGRGAITNGQGQYEIDVKETDSIWFSYLGKPTIKYPVLKMSDPLRFDISINLGAQVLKEVRVVSPDYRQDSLQNRVDYAKVFNYEKPKLKTSVGGGPEGVGVGFDLDEIIRMFQFRKNKMMLSFQQRLIEQEKEKFIDHRFSKALVLRLTGLTGGERDSFMTQYRPNYEFTQTASDYDFQLYIKRSFAKWRKAHPAQKPEDSKGF